MIQHVIAVTPIPGGYVLELDDASTFRWPGDNEAVPTVGDAVTVEVRDTPGCGLLRWVGLAGYLPVPEMRTGTAYAPLAAPPPVERVRPEPTVTVNAVTCPTDSTWIAYLSDGRAFASTTSAPKPGTPVWFGEGGAMHWPAGTAEHCPAILEDFERLRRAAHPLDPDRDQAPVPYIAPVAARIAAECDRIKALLLEKNRKYGNSALEPVRVFSKADATEQIRVRIDDKLCRLARGLDDDEDTVLDLVGYLVLLLVARS